MLVYTKSGYFFQGLLHLFAGQWSNSCKFAGQSCKIRDSWQVCNKETLDLANAPHDDFMNTLLAVKASYYFVPGIMLVKQCLERALSATLSIGLVANYVYSYFLLMPSVQKNKRIHFSSPRDI